MKQTYEKASEMVIRMFEYDISIALEHASDSGEIWEIEFPQPCVLYVLRLDYYFLA